MAHGDDVGLAIALGVDPPLHVLAIWVGTHTWVGAADRVGVANCFPHPIAVDLAACTAASGSVVVTHSVLLASTDFLSSHVVDALAFFVALTVRDRVAVSTASG